MPNESQLLDVSASGEEEDAMLILQQQLDGYTEDEKESVALSPEGATVSIESPSPHPTEKAWNKQQKEDLEEVFQIDHLFRKKVEDSNTFNAPTSSVKKVGDETKWKRLLSAENAIQNAKSAFKDNLRSNSYAAPKHTDKYDHVPASAVSSGQSVKAQSNSTAGSILGLPSIGWHVPLAGIGSDIKGSKQGSEQASALSKDAAQKDAKRKSISIKEKERLKRYKGQSSQHSWKPEEFMRLKQSYD